MNALVISGIAFLVFLGVVAVVMTVTQRGGRP